MPIENGFLYPFEIKADIYWLVMTTLLPKYISETELMKLLQQEIPTLDASDLAWWKSHSLSPFVVMHGESAHFVVAAAGQDILFFADDEDEFGVAKLEAGSRTMIDFGLAGDLKDAIGCVRHIGGRFGPTLS